VTDAALLAEAIHRLSGGLPIAWARHRAVCLVDLERGAEERLEPLEGRKVAAVCGIGRPAAFLHTLGQLGADIVAAKAFPDHHAFTGDDRRAIAAAAAAGGAEWIVTTEKDAVRLGGGGGLGRPTFALRIALDILRGADALERLVGVRPDAVGRG
jgi:tetraacyldisaccharide 4'-kinase